MSKSLNTKFSTSQTVVATTATPIVAERSGRDTVVIENHGTTNVFLGNSGVTTSTGLLLPGVVGASVAIETTEAIYGIVGTGTQAVSSIENF